MNIPDDYELLSLFEAEPVYSDDISRIPPYYNTASYSFKNNNNQDITVTVSPADSEMKISVKQQDETVCYFSFRDLITLSILKDDKSESRIMLTKQNTVIKINFRPVFRIFLEDGIDR